MILIDTNVVSEALRPNPEPRVIQWLNQNFPAGYLSAITIFELRSGVAVLPKSKRKTVLQSAIGRMIQRFGARTIAFDQAAAHRAAEIFAGARKKGRPLGALPAKLADLQIAGICVAFGLKLATRNGTDFMGAGIAIVDPWRD